MTKSEEFSGVFAAYSTPVLLDALERLPALLRLAVAGLPIAALRAHAIPGKWSITEIVAHIADGAAIWYGRTLLVICQPSSTFQVYNQDAFARVLRHADLDNAGVQTRVDLYGSLCGVLTPSLRALDGDAWSKTGLHPEFGALTLRNMLELQVDHGCRHIAQIADRRKLLAQPCEVTLPISTRLY